MKILLRNLERENDTDEERVKVSFTRTSAHIVDGMALMVPEVTFTCNDRTFTVSLNSLESVVVIVKHYINNEMQRAD